MQATLETLKHICSVTEICEGCPFLKDIKDRELLKLRMYHLEEMNGDYVYRPNCKETADVADHGDHPMCRGAVVYMLKTNRLNAALKLAIDEGIISVESLMAEASLVID